MVKSQTPTDEDESRTKPQPGERELHGDWKKNLPWRQLTSAQLADLANGSLGIVDASQRAMNNRVKQIVAGPVAFAMILAGACAAEPEQDINLDQADFSGLRLPMSLYAGETRSLSLKSSEAFTVKFEQQNTQSEMFLRIFSDYIEQGITSVGVAPSLSVTPPGGSERDFEVQVRSLQDYVDGFLVVSAGGTPECSDSTFTAWLDNLRSRIEGSGSIIDQTEAAAIGHVMRAKPCESNSAVVYDHWTRWFAATLAQVDSIIDANEQVIVNYVMSVLPLATGSGPYGRWFEVWANQLGNDGSIIDQNETLLLNLIHRAKPTSEADESYLLWIQRVASVTSTFDSIVDSNEQALVTAWLRSKPCTGQTDATYRAWSEWQTGASSAVVAAFSDAMRPSACQ